MRPWELEAWIVERIARVLRAEAPDIDVRTPLTTLGIDSAAAVGIVGELEGLLGRPLSVTLVYDHPTVESLVRFLATDDTPHPTAPAGRPAAGEPIAVVGLACRVPGGDDATALWHLLRDGRDGIAAAASGPRAEDFRRCHPGQHAGLLERVDLFDAGFFGITPREAVRMDPQQRLLLGVAWDALEDGGIVPAALAGTRTGVFVGISFSEHGAMHLHDPAFADGYAGTGNALSVAANRISYLLDLRGPSMAIDTACSSSLVGVHQACRSLQAGDCDLALVGGVNVILSAAVGGDFGSAGVLAPDGRCKTFDNQADGYVRSEGAGFLILKPWSAAVADGDRIYCAVQGSAVNHDGRTNGLLAPSPASQTALLRAACADAAADPRDIAYVEAHGTGTLLGDAVEAQALGTVIGRGRPVGSPLRIGSIKSNIGHLEAAAGVIGMIKVALALHHGRIPPSVHHRHPNANIDFDALNLEVQQELTPWPAGGHTLAGVSSFGFGGANAHVVLGRVPAGTGRVDAVDSGPQLVTLSARTPAALDELTDRYLDSLHHGPLSTLPALNGVARSAATRRQHHEHRLAVVASTPRELVDRLLAARSGGLGTAVRRGRAGRRPPRLAFVFGGQSSRWWPWADELLHHDAAFRDAFTRCRSIAADRWGIDLLAAVTREATAPPAPEVGQAAFYAVQASMAASFRARGVRPAAVIGHSLGEVGAAVTAGCLSLEAGLDVAYHRGRCIGAHAPAGRMAVVGLSAADTERLIEPFGGRVVVAAVNSPGSVVISGEPDAVSQAVEQVVDTGAFGRVLDAVGFASHGPDMGPVAEALAGSVSHLAPEPPAVPMLSTVAGTDGRDIVVGDAAYWARNLRQPVRFVDALRRAVADERIDVFLEIGPEPGLGRAMQESLADDAGGPVVLPSTATDTGSTARFLDTLAELHVTGVPLSWGPTAPHACVLPTYPWQRTSYWWEPRAALPGPVGSATDPLLGERVDLAAGGGYVWNSVLSLPRLAFLRDHAVRGEAVLPATAYVELARRAAATLGRTGLLLRDLRLLVPLSMPESDDVRVQTVVSPGAAGSWSLRVYGRAPSAATWTVHAEGRLEVAGEPTGEPPPPDHPLGMAEVDVAALYRSLAGAGLAYGPAFRRLDRLWSDGRRALGHVRGEQGPDAAAPDGFVTVLDACLHGCAALVEEPQSGRPWIPTSCDAVVFHRAAVPDRAVVHATVSDRREGSMVIDIAIADGTGLPVVEFRHLRLQELPGDGAPEAVWTYCIDWEPVPTPVTAGVEGPAGAAAPWLIVAGRGGGAAAIRDALAAAGQPTELLDAPAAGPLQLGRDALRAYLADRRPAAGWRGILAAWPLDRPADGRDHDSAEAAADIVLAAVDLLWALGNGLDSPPPVLFVTSGSLAAAPLVGIARVVPLELPDIDCRVIDVGEASPSVMAGHVAREIAADGRDGWVVWRDGVRSVARLVPAPLPPARDLPVIGTALVTGAFGGLGSVLVGWLARCGVRSIVLVGRTGPSPAASSLIERLRSEGVQVVTAAADVSRRAEVERLLTALPDELPPITKVFHLAGVLSDGALVDLGPEQVGRVLAPKARGAWNLHEATRGLPLDTFVLFSSAVSVLGSPGQANYAAANAYLDALARHRRSQGLPGLSINWGPWGEVGLVADRAGDRRAQFASAFDPDEAVELVGRFVAGDSGQVLALPYDLRNLLQHYPKVAGSAFFARVADDALLHGYRGGGGAYGRPDLAAPYVAARSELERLIRSMWERALSIEGIGVRDGFFELGGDSVVANQVVVQVERRFQIRIDRKAVFDDMTVEGVAALVEGELEKKLNELSDETVDHLIGELEA